MNTKMMSVNLVTIVLLFLSSAAQSPNTKVVFRFQDVSLAVGETRTITLDTDPATSLSGLLLFLNHSQAIRSPRNVTLNNGTAEFPITGEKVISRTILEVVRCESKFNAECGLDLSQAFSRVSVLKSHYIEYLVIAVGWSYFFAWSISFYPQIWLNFQRKSVVGLNFDFLFLNVIGFAAYTLYNTMLYWNGAVQSEYAHENPRSPLPVLMNDVVFAVHALLACIFTALQAIIYERNDQRISRLCLLYGGILIFISCFCGVLTATHTMSLLQFVSSLSYIKMAVTLSKYFPQAIFNYKRKSTVGWSIGNVLLDFTGGSLDVLQMVLQGWNVNNWSGFSGNPVKFGLGLVSIVFDVLFIIQHYVLYRKSEVPLSDFENEDLPNSSLPETQHFDPDSSTNSNNPIVPV